MAQYDDAANASRAADTPSASGVALARRDTTPDRFPDAPSGEHSLDLQARFVGRANHLNQLKQLLHRCLEKRALRFVTLIGEPGAGKTRLALEFARSVRAALPAARVLYVEGTVNPSGYEWVVRVLCQRFGIGHGEHPDDARRKIVAGVAEVLPEERRMDVSHLLAHLLGCPFAESPVVEPLAEMPGQLEMRTYIAVRRFLEHDAERGPLLLCFDGMERARPETVNLIHYLASGLRACPVMIVAAARPTVFRGHPQWGQGDFAHRRIDVGALAPTEAEELFRELARAAELPEVLLQMARERLPPIPRALKEFTRFLVESGVLCLRDDGWIVDSDRIASTALPRTHEEILAARIATLPTEERAVLECAAAVGEAFWLDAVVALERASALTMTDPDGPDLTEIAAKGDRTRNDVATALSSLCARGLFVACSHSSIAGEREYRFAYPPIWDLAYERISPADKQRNHRLVAQWLELHPLGRTEGQQEQVGYHLQRAGDGRGAASRYRRAADEARGRYYNHKAIRLYRRALSCMDETDVAVRIHIWHDLSSVYQLKGEVDSALDAVERMVRLSWVIANRPKAAVAFNKMGRLWREKGNLELALEYLERGLAMFRECNDERGIASSLDDIAQVYRLLGRYDEALDRSAKALEMRRQLGDKRSMAVSLSNIGNIEKDRGLFDEAEACYREALELRREVGDRYGFVVSLNNIADLASSRGELEAAREMWQQALVEAEQIGALPLQVVVFSSLAETAYHMGKLADARQRLQRAMALAREIEDQRSYIDVLRHLALVELQEGNPEKALRHADECLKLAKKAHLLELVGKAHMALGEVRAATLFDASSPIGTESAAESHFVAAAKVFREMRNEAELARALKRVGEYRVEHGDPDAAREALQEAAEIFERIGMPDAAAIRNVLAGL